MPLAGASVFCRPQRLARWALSSILGMALLGNAKASCDASTLQAAAAAADTQTMMLLAVGAAGIAAKVETAGMTTGDGQQQVFSAGPCSSRQRCCAECWNCCWEQAGGKRDCKDVVGCCLFPSHVSTVSQFLNQPDCNRLAGSETGRLAAQQVSMALLGMEAWQWMQQCGASWVGF